MSERLNKLLEFEDRLMVERKKLMELMAQGDSEERTESKLVEYKLECLQKELVFLSRQAEILKSDIREREHQVKEEANIAPIDQVASAVRVTVEEPKKDSFVTQKVPLQAENVVAREKPQESTFKENGNRFAEAGRGINREEFTAKKDLEKTIGKSLMGIFASVLIFISLILFATLLLPYFNDTAKMITTYVVSFAFLSVGVVKLRKEPENKFYLALTGCGMGALYISLLLSNMYFKMLGDILLYVLLCIWGIGVGLFSKNRSMLFQIIGELGILIAMVFGCILCVEEGDAVKYIALIVFYVISAGIFYALHYKEEFAGNLIRHIFNVINLCFMAVSCFAFGNEPMRQVEVWMVFALVIVCFGCTLWHKLEKESFSFSVFAVIYLIIIYVMLDFLCSEEWIFGMITYVSAVLLLALLQWKKANSKEGKYIVQAMLLIMAVIGVNCWESSFSYGAVPMLIIPALAAGFLLKNPVFKYGGLAIAFLYLFEEEPIGVVGHFLLCALAVLVGYVLLHWKKEQYNRGFKCCLYILTILVLLTCFNDFIYELSGDAEWEILGTYMALVAYNIAVMKSVFSKNLLTGEKEPQTLYNIVNMLFMIFGLYYISDGSFTQVQQFLLIIVTLITFLINSKNFLDKRENMFAGIYVGIKFVIFMIIVLNSFDAANYVISIACLLFAILSIIIGFAGEYKSLRIFGLVLSMISIFKLLMIDISYENTLGNALSFFVSGILCFVISLIYNYIDKKVQQRA